MEKFLVLFVEGETEVAFYKSLVKCIHDSCPGRLGARIEYRNVNGVGGFKNNAIRKFKNEILRKYGSEFDYTVALCHDTDVFEYAEKPPINWNDLKKDFISIGVKKVVQVKAEKSIEDWFLIDEKGIKKYLRLPQKEKISGSSGYDRLRKIFNKAGKIYLKGSRCDGLVDHLDIELIMQHIHNEIKPLLDVLLPE